MSRTSAVKPKTLLGAILMTCAREEGGLERLALELEVQAQAVRKWIRGEAEPTGPALKRLARYLNVSMDEVVDWHAVAEHSVAQPSVSRCH